LQESNGTHTHISTIVSTQMMHIVDPSCLLWAILQLYVSTLLCLIPLSICLLYSLLRLIKCNDASEASILCSLAGCAFYGIVVSSLWKEDMENQQQARSNKRQPPRQPIALKVATWTGGACSCISSTEATESDDDDVSMMLERKRDYSFMGATDADRSDGTFGTIVSSTASFTPSATSTTTTANACCPVCLELLVYGDAVSYGETCAHVFHADCVHKWTALLHTTCPCCRQELLCPISSSQNTNDEPIKPAAMVSNDLYQPMASRAAAVVRTASSDTSAPIASRL
jgi:Ring finger domain